MLKTWRLLVPVFAVASMIGVPLLAASAPAGAAGQGKVVVGSVSATPNTNVFDGTSLSVTGTAPSPISSVVLIECDSTQSSDIGSPYDPNHCDTSASDEVTLPVNNTTFSGSFVFHDPLNTTGAGTVDCAAGCVLLADNPTPGDVSSEMMLTGNSCNGVFSGAATGSLVKTTSAGPSGSTVAPSQTIAVTLTWSPSDFGGKAPSKSDDCVEIGSTLSPTLSQEDKHVSASGTDTSFSYQVPSGGTNGQPICDRGAVSGTGTSSGIEKSAILCYTVMGVATPEAPMALLLPVAGLLVGGGGLLLARRRRAATRLPL